MVSFFSQHEQISIKEMEEILEIMHSIRKIAPSRYPPDSVNQPQKRTNHEGADDLPPRIARLRLYACYRLLLDRRVAFGWCRGWLLALPLRRRHSAAAIPLYPGEVIHLTDSARSAERAPHPCRGDACRGGRSGTHHGPGSSCMALRRRCGRGARSRRRPAVAHPAARPRRRSHPHGRTTLVPCGSSAPRSPLRQGLLWEQPPASWRRCCSRGEPHPPPTLAGAARHGAPQGGGGGTPSSGSPHGGWSRSRSTRPTATCWHRDMHSTGIDTLFMQLFGYLEIANGLRSSLTEKP